MKSFILSAATTAALFAGGQASLFGTGSKVEASAFLATNEFGNILNGQNNKINVVIENKHDVEIDISQVYGTFKDASSEKLIRNTTALQYKASVPVRSNLTLPYQVYSEFKPGDVKLSLWVEYLEGGHPHHIQAYDSIVNVIEPPASIFDIQLLATYLILLGLVGGGAYFGYNALYPKPKKSKSKASAPSTKAPVVEVKASGYEDEWIPEHHVKTRSRKSKSGASALSSGDEASILDSPLAKKTRSGKKRA